MNKISIEELQENFDAYLDRVEEGESFLVTSEHGEVVLTRYMEKEETFDDLERIHTELNNDAP